jgi:uncharacterized protein
LRLKRILAFDHRALLQTLLIATAFGALFELLHLPLAWMLGAMLSIAVAAIAGVRVLVPTPLRTGVVPILGVLLGSQFTPKSIELISHSLLSLASLVPYILVTGAATAVYFSRFSGFDRTTRFFAGMPGGFSEMVIAGGAMGGDERRIALSHTSRIIFIVTTIPLWFQLTAGISRGTGGRSTVWLSDIALDDLGMLSLCAVIGGAIGHWLRIPVGTLIGPLLASTALHLLGLTASQPPYEVVAVAQVLLGASVGARFRGTTATELINPVLIATGASIIMLCVSLVFAASLHWVTGIPLPQLLLAFAPGGLAEMCLVALALNTDAVFVAMHHAVRLLLVALLAPTMFRYLFGDPRKPP